MTIKKRFAEKYGKHTKRRAKLYKLAKIKDQSPIVYSADAIMKAANPRGGEDARCDDFVLCECDSVTGVYIVEEKKGEAEKKAAKQLQAGANFMSPFIGSERC